ncbi:MAG: hypothetical protein ACR2NB_12225 [Solirubrobacteraceae bacterium]
MRRLLPAAATVVGVAVALRVAYDAWYLNYDARYVLLWAPYAPRGLTPDYEAPFAPTPHPLSTAWSVLALPFGQGGDALIVWFVLLSFGALVYLAYRLGAELFSPAVGAVTAVVVLTRPVMERDALLGYQDVPFAVLIVLAALLEARRPRRGAPVLALLAVAGLLRPEAWALGGLYWLYLFPSRAWPQRVRLAGLVVAAPLLWALMDVLVTGDALHSLHGTVDLARTADRRREVSQVPYWTAKYFGSTLRAPLVIGVPLGLAFAWRHRARFGRAAALPLAVAAIMTAVFAINPFFGLPLIGRYVRTPSVFLALFFGLAVAGWSLLGEGRERKVWQAVGAVAVLGFFVFAPANAEMLRGLHKRFHRDGKVYADLRAAGRAERVRAAARACGPILAADHRPVPYLRYWLSGDPGSVGTVESGARSRVLLLPRRTVRNRLFYGAAFPRVSPPPGAQRVYQNRSWRVFAAPDCRRLSSKSRMATAGRQSI